jgi:hypothetical protein
MVAEMILGVLLQPGILLPTSRPYQAQTAQILGRFLLTVLPVTAVIQIPRFRLLLLGILLQAHLNLLGISLPQIRQIPGQFLLPLFRQPKRLVTAVIHSLRKLLGLLAIILQLTPMAAIHRSRKCLRLPDILLTIVTHRNKLCHLQIVVETYAGKLPR